MMRVTFVLLLLSLTARGLSAIAGPDWRLGGLPQGPARQVSVQNDGLTRAVLSCRGGSAAATSTVWEGAGATAYCGDRVDGKGDLLRAVDTGKRGDVKLGWGQLRRTPEARTSSSTHLLGPRGGAGAVTSADVSKEAYKTALLRTGLLVCSAGAFGLGTFVVKGKTSALEFFAGYIVEQSLSVDNLFIFIMLFDYFKVPAEFQSRVLNWGIIGAVSMRAIMIVVGVAAIQRFRAVMLVFAGILVVSSVKLLMEGTEEDHGDSSALEGNMVLRIANWMMDSTDFYDGEKFFTLVDGVKKATPLLLCLICIEMTDFVFAVDSIPAVLAISQDTFIVYASNVFAICAMRSIYTLVSHAISDLPYLKPAVALVLGFVGGKMFAEFFHYDISVGLSLGVVCGILGIGAIASVISNKRRDASLAASSVSGGGSSGLTFQAISAAAEEAGGHGGDIPAAAAAAATAAAATAAATADTAPADDASTAMTDEGDTSSPLEKGESTAAEGSVELKAEGTATSTAAADDPETAGGDDAGEVVTAAAMAVDNAVEEIEEEGAEVGENVSAMEEGAGLEGLKQDVAHEVDAVGDSAESIANDVEGGITAVSQQVVADDVTTVEEAGEGSVGAPDRTEDA